jgi:selenocysteine lyase/cysteine desulfurase
MPERLVRELADEQVYVAPRIGRMRISPHVYNDEEDIERFLASFRQLAPRERVTSRSRMVERQ